MFCKYTTSQKWNTAIMDFVIQEEKKKNDPHIHNF